MDDQNALFVDLVLPGGVLLKWEEEGIGQTPSDAGLHPNDCDAVWYSARPECMVLAANGGIECWHPAGRIGVAARPAKPNREAEQLIDGGLRFRSGVNGGFVAEDALVDPEQFTVAVHFGQSGGEARTLASLNPKDHKNYLFLSEKEGRLTFADQAESSEVSLPSPGKEAWAVASYSHGRLGLAVFAPGDTPGTPVFTTGSISIAASMLGASDLFIGCRSNRKGILKTLGTSVIADVLFWLDMDCLENPEGLQRVANACRYAELGRDL